MLKFIKQLNIIFFLSLIFVSCNGGNNKIDHTDPNQMTPIAKEGWNYILNEMPNSNTIKCVFWADTQYTKDLEDMMSQYWPGIKLCEYTIETKNELGEVYQELIDVFFKDDLPILYIHKNEASDNDTNWLNNKINKAWYKKGIEKKSSSNNPQYINDGWKFILNDLKSIEGAKFTEYVNMDDIKGMILGEFPQDFPNVDVVLYSVEAQNSYGALVKEKIVVFFNNKKPVYCIPLENFKELPQLVLINLKGNWNN